MRRDRNNPVIAMLSVINLMTGGCFAADGKHRQ
jgi:hypothetical protein